MERAHQLGYARSIGVSNFGVRDLDTLLADATTSPVVDQVRFSPFDFARKLLDAASKRHVVVEAYSPLGTGQYLSSRIVQRVAAQVGRTPAQVLLRWGLQRNVVVLPKSTHRERIEENARIFDFTLGDEELATLDALNRMDGSA
jgi:diketogulonate reductase-like aldo/keto reductase